MDERIIEALSTVAGCSYEAAERLLEDECGAYANVDGCNVWISGALIRRVCQIALEL